MGEKPEPLFYRCSTDGRVFDCSFLENSCGGSTRSSVWLIGGGPSLLTAPIDAIKESHAPKFGVNLSGRGKDGVGPLIRPDLWTCFDPTARFHRSIYLDPSIQKFMLGGRRMDLVPGGSEKLCDCPNTYFINHEVRANYTDAFGQHYRKIVHMLDSFVQALDIAFRLGFRKFYCVGCDMRVSPSEEQIQFAESLGVVYDRERMCVVIQKNGQEIRSDLLTDFRDQVKEKGKFKDRSTAALELEKLGREGQYSFDEKKRFLAACSSDKHYWDRVQYLRQAKKNMSLNGMDLISCTPGSRLNAFFEYVDPLVAARRIAYETGSPAKELTVGRYTTEKDPALDLPYHSDIKPYGWKEQPVEKIKAEPEVVNPVPRQNRREEIASQLAQLVQKRVEINEEGA